MNKTDKEITAEIVISYVNSWNGNSSTVPLKPNDLLEIIKNVHEVVTSLSGE